MKLIAINEKQWTNDVMREAIRAAARSRKPFTILAKNGEFYATHTIDYSGGERYPKLIRVEGPDLLGLDLAPLVAPREGKR
jgi:hypothetical protein